MTRDVVAVGPATSAKHAGELMAGHGFAALPVVDDDGRLLGIAAEVDVLRDRLPEDPLLHVRRGEPGPVAPPALLVGGVMTTAVRTVEPTVDVADLARLFARPAAPGHHGGRRDRGARLVRPGRRGSARGGRTVTGPAVSGQPSRGARP
jgi:CBS domain-containing protein